MKQNTKNKRLRELQKSTAEMEEFVHRIILKIEHSTEWDFMEEWPEKKAIAFSPYHKKNSLVRLE